MGNYCTTSVTELPDASTVIEGTELPEWVSAGGKALFEQAANIAQSPYPSYTGPRITTYDGSKLTPEEQQAAEILGRGTSSYEPYVSEAGERAMGLGQGYDSMSREELLGPDYEGATREELIGKAMDPFSLESAQPYLDIYQTAADPAVREAGQTMFDTLAGIRAKASQGAGSFGSRLGILEGQTIADALKLSTSMFETVLLSTSIVLFVNDCEPVSVATVESIAKVTALPLPDVSIPVPPVNVKVSLSRSMLNAPPLSA